MVQNMSPMKLLPSVVAIVLVLGASCVEGHVRLECPPPFSPDTGEKVGPCDVSTDVGDLAAFPLKANAFNTVTFLESIPHPGAPARFALSREGGGSGTKLDEATLGFETCLLLDHIPHDEHSQPDFADQTTWHRQSITLWIPDVKCERCYLQLVSVMSDGLHGVPTDTKCAYKGALAHDPSIGDYPGCPVVYHSCSPVSIDGSIPRNDIDVCNTTEFEEKLGWPLTPQNNSDIYEYSIYFNRADVGLYTTDDARLQSVGSPITDDICTSPFYCDPDSTFVETISVPEDAPYALLEGTCSAVVTNPVEPFVLGEYPGKVSTTTPPVVDTPVDEESVAAPEEEEVVDPAPEEMEGEETSTSSGVRISTSSAIYLTTATLTLFMSLFLVK